MARTLCVLAAVAALCVCVAGVSAHDEPVMAPAPGGHAVAAAPGAPCPCGVPAGMYCGVCVRRYAPVYCRPVCAPICAPAYPCGYPVYRVYRPLRPWLWGGYAVPVAYGYGY